MFKIKNIKKGIASLLAVISAAGCLSAGSVAFAEDLVAINETNFADKNFRTVISDVYDKDGNGYLSTAEIERVKVMTPSAYLDDDETITSLSGIEKFYNLEKLYCASLGLKELDVSKNTKLTSVTCMGNELTSLTVGSLPELTWLNCSNNNLTSLDVTNCPALQTLQASVNSISSIDLSNNTQLTSLYVFQNNIAKLDLSNNTSLAELICNSNHIAELDLSGNTLLENTSTENVGDQWIELSASIKDNNVVIPCSFADSSKITSTTLDTVKQTDDGEETILAYSNGMFVANELIDISGKLTTANQEVKDGFVYKYNTGNSNCDLMTVNAVVSRNMYQVNFYLDESKSVRLAYQLVETGKNASAPDVPDAPTCKKFVSWSEDFSNITSDKDIYIVWADDHNMVKSIDDATGDVDIKCTKCNQKTLHFNFMEAYNSAKGDDNYNADADLNGDGYVNAKDYAIILKY
ncbi:MAG: hypothetical protein Q4C99_01125 [Clostridia bacterium]|nr:hypothetical protein [Clostridia bacterium]